MTGKMTKVGLAASAVSIAASIYIYFSYNKKGIVTDTLIVIMQIPLAI